MKNQITLKLLALFAFTGETFAKSTPIEPSLSFLGSIDTTESVNSFMLTPLELIQPVSFEPNNFIDFSMAFNLFWF
ncbi:MAG: hypothetical protein KAG56_08665 [Sulfurovaceae bacterium]|nr:hypothetical protein [Sulfurovaceae bacterium]